MEGFFPILILATSCLW